MNNKLPVRKHLKRIPVRIPESQRVIYFVTVCCYEKRKIFISDAVVCIALQSFVKCAHFTKWNILKICFMPDHVHVLLSPEHDREQRLSKIMQRWKSSSKQRLNRFGIEGDIWQKEFFDHLIRSEKSLTEKWDYVELNPVLAGLCEEPDNYPYLGKVNDILSKAL